MSKPYTFGVEGCGHMCSDCSAIRMFQRKYLTEEKPALEAEVKKLREINEQLQADLEWYRRHLKSYDDDACP